MAKKSEVVVAQNTTNEQAQDATATATATAQPTPKQEPTLADLEKIQDDAIAHAMEIQKDATKNNIEKSKAWAAVTKAGNDINAFIAREEKLKNERALKEKIELAKNDLCDKLHISLDELNALLKDETIRASFITVFGKPAIIAKEGQSGKSLVGGGEKSASGKSSDITADLAAGMTYEQLLEKYPTKNPDGTFNTSKLNGTARTVISNGGWKKQSDGTYLQEAK